MSPTSTNVSLREYYEDNDTFLSAEGILKILSVIVCIVSAILFLTGGSCSTVQLSLVTSAATIALACGVIMTLLYVGATLGVPLYAPQIWLFTDIILSTVMGILLLVTAVLSMTLCVMDKAVDYLHGPLAAINAGLVTASAIITYTSVMQKLDSTRGPTQEPVRPQPTEQEV